MQLTYDEFIELLDMKFIPTKTTGYFLNPDIYEVVDLNNTLKNVLPDNKKVKVIIDDVRLKSDLEINQTLNFTNKSFFYTLNGLTRSHSYPLDDIDGFYQLIAGSYKNYRPISITGVDEIHLKLIVLMVVLSMVPENQFYTHFFCLHHPDIKFTKNLESNFLKR